MGALDEVERHDDHGGRGHAHGGMDVALAGSDRGIRAVKVSLVALGATAGVQAFIVALSGSIALLADTIHNATDALTAIPLWVAFVVGRRKPTKRYSYGYERAEDLAGIMIVVVIAASAAFAAWEAVNRLIEPREVTHLPWVMAAAIVGFAGNELVAMYRIRVGKRIGSAALVAAAMGDVDQAEAGSA